MDVVNFQYHLRMTYADCTVGNHVYYARYFDMLEAARGEWFRSLGRTFQSWQDQGVLFPVVESHARYLAPARYDDSLAIEVWLTRLDRIRLHFAYRIVGPTGTVLIHASTHHVCTNLEGKPTRLPADLASTLTPFVRPADTS